MAFDLPDLSPASTVALMDKNSSKVKTKEVWGEWSEGSPFAVAGAASSAPR